MLVLRDGGVGSDLINCVSAPAASKPCSVSKIFLASPDTAANRPPSWRCIWSGLRGLRGACKTIGLMPGSGVEPTCVALSRCTR